jgi:hypothetical protein
MRPQRHSLIPVGFFAQAPSIGAKRRFWSVDRERGTSVNMSAVQLEPNVAPGQINITQLEQGRMLVEIGRSRRTKRLHLSHTEASELRDRLITELGSQR